MKIDWSLPLNNRNTFLLLLLILVFTFLIFSPTINYDFLRCHGDHAYILDNQIVQEGMSLNNIGRIFSSFFLENYHPITLLSFTFDQSVFGFQSQYFHLLNLLLHLFNCMLVFVLIYWVSRRSGIALIATLLFAIHPLRVESVAWISARKDLLAATLAFLSLIAYTYYQRQRKLDFYILCLISFMLSLLSGTLALGLPFVLFLFDYLNEKRAVFERWFEKIPFFAVSIIALIIMWIARQDGQYRLDWTISGIGDTLLTAAHRFIFYFSLRQFMPFWPSLLRPDLSTNSPIPFYYFAGFSIIMVIIIVFLVAIWRRNREFVFATGFFMIGVAPLLFVMIPEYSADHLAYFVAPAVSFLFALSAVSIYERVRKNRLYGYLTVAGASATGLYFLVITMNFLPVWKNCLRLTTYFIYHYPHDANVFVNRGLVYNEMTEYNKAKEDFEKALDIDQNCAEASRCLGLIFHQQADPESALYYYQQAIKSDPKNAEAYFLLGNLYYDNGYDESAISSYSRAVERDPSAAKFYFGRANAYDRHGMHKAAIDDYTSVLRISPAHEVAMYNRAIAYTLTGEHDRALADLSNLLKIKPDNNQARYARAVILFRQGAYQDAREDIDVLLRDRIPVDPAFLEALNRNSTIKN